MDNFSKNPDKLSYAYLLTPSFCLGHWQVIWLAQMPKPNRPVPRRTNIRIRPARIVPRHPMKALKPLGQHDGRLRNLHHRPAFSKVRDKNQKFSTPDHKA